MGIRLQPLHVSILLRTMDKIYSFPGNSTLRAVRINGFGACMIAGVPHAREESFFHLALLELSLATGIGIHSRLTSLQGFPTHKASKHVVRALKDAPDILVIQLGSTDLTTNLTGTIRSRLGGPSPISASASGSHIKPVGSPAATGPIGPYKTSSRRNAIQHLKFLLCKLLRVKPVHGDESVYIPAIASVLDAALAAGSVPVLLAPFPHGDLVSDSWARRYTQLLERLAQEKGAVFVNTYHGLLDIPKSELLLEDQLHLSKLGHRRVAELLAEALRGTAPLKVD